MAVVNHKRMTLIHATLLAGVALQTLAMGMSAPAMAQQTSDRLDSLRPNMPEDAKLLLSANELVYNKDAEKVIVRGNVQIDYGGYKMVARQVEYDQKNGRIYASGEVQFVEPGGNVVYADKMDVTDDFGDGFLEQMRIETTDLTRLAATSGERRNGEEFILNEASVSLVLTDEVIRVDSPQRSGNGAGAHEPHFRMGGRFRRGLVRNVQGLERVALELLLHVENQVEHLALEVVGASVGHPIPTRTLT